MSASSEFDLASNLLFRKKALYSEVLRGSSRFTADNLHMIYESPVSLSLLGMESIVHNRENKKQSQRPSDINENHETVGDTLLPSPERTKRPTVGSAIDYGNSGSLEKVGSICSVLVYSHTESLVWIL
jgi:hypothetical protein